MRKAKRILVGLKILENAVELTDLACRLGARGAELLLIHEIELPDNTPSTLKCRIWRLRRGKSCARASEWLAAVV